MDKKLEKDVIQIELIENQVISQLQLTNLVEDNDLLHVKVTEDTRFIDNVWDFSRFNIKNQNNSSFVFDFTDVDYIYRNYVKTFVLRNLYERRLEIPTIESRFNKIKNFITYLKQHSVFTVELLNVYEVNDYLMTNKELKVASLSNIKKAIKGLIMEIEFKNPNLDFEGIYELLDEFDSQRYKYERELGKHPLIPKEIHKKILQYALNDIKSDQLDLVDKMSACMIIILAETGMRIMEFQNLKSNALKSIVVKNETQSKFYYLEFMTYKTVKEVDGKLTQTFVTENVMLAYQTLQDILKERKKSPLDYLYCTTERKAYNTLTLRSHIKRFFIRHRFDLNIIKMSKSNRDCFSSLIIDENLVKTISWLTKDVIGEEVYYAVPHQFRVYLATDLYNKGVHLDWIRRHMNHMSTIMTEHYIRIQQEEKRKHTHVETLMRRVSKAGMLETNQDEINEEQIKKELNDEEYRKAYNDINKFLKKSKLNIYNNLDEIIALLGKTQTPIVETELGYCAHKGFLKLCKHQEYISSLDDGYSVGIMLPTLEEFAFTYQRFEEKSKIVDYNESLMMKDSRYEREYIKELKAITLFINKKVLLELDEVKKELKNKGESYVKALYPGLDNIIDNLTEVEERILLWKKQSELKLKSL